MECPSEKKVGPGHGFHFVGVARARGGILLGPGWGFGRVYLFCGTKLNKQKIPRKKGEKVVLKARLFAFWGVRGRAFLPVEGAK